MPSCCGEGGGVDIGDAAVLVFRFTPVPQHPTVESLGVTVTVLRPDGTVFGTYSAPDPSLSSAAHNEMIAGVLTLVTEWTFEMPTPFDVGSKRNPWRLRAESTAGIMAAVETERWVKPSAFA